MRLVLAVLALLAGGFTSALAQDRVALVIGNNRYNNLPDDKQLAKAVNDARAVGGALEKLGFKVIRGENLNRAQMVDQVFSFTQAIKPGDTAVVFFAGHGVSLSGGNYLLPTDVPLPRPGEENRARNLSLGEADIIAEIQERKPRVLVMMLDACRDNPFRQPGMTRSVGSETGLSRGREAEGVFTIYSAGFGQSALDSLGPDDKSPNSVFTRSLIPALARTDVHLADLVIDMRDDVIKLAATVGHHQSPAYYDQTSGGRVYLAARSPVQPVKPKPAPRRVALVIGNKTYPSHVNLATPGNDADAVATMLREAKFDEVVVRNDLTRDAMINALRGFAAQSAGAELALIYYSGHASRLGPNRLLLGTDMKVKSESDLRQQGVDLNEAIDGTANAATRLVVIDADQKEAFVPAKPSTPQTEPLDPRGAVVIYSAGATEAALDGTGATSPFTEAFVRNFRPRGAPFRDAFGKLQREVSAATNKVQTPVVYGTPPASFSLLAQ